MKIDLQGEERFGRFTSALYAFFSSRFAGPELHEFASKDILRSNPKSILDVGTGPGDLPIMLASGSNGIELYAVDPSPDMLRIARKKARGVRVHFAIGYSQRLPFRKRYDMIVSTISFHHWAHKKESLIYLSGFLNKNGEIRIYEFEKPEHKVLWFIKEGHSMSKDELRDASSGTGLYTKGIIRHDGMLRATYSKRR